jgi:K+-sensing histidine kinase KdpD
MLLQSVVDKIIEILEPAEFGMVFLWDEQTKLLRPHAAAGQGIMDLQPLFDLGLRESESITGRVFTTQETQLLDVQAAVTGIMAGLQPANRKLLDAVYGPDIHPLSVIAAPLSAGENRYGVLVLETLQGHAFFSERDLPFVQALADLIGLEIDRARLDAVAIANRETEEADRLRSELMATFSHELRTPLATIKGYSTALLLEEVDWPAEKQREFLRLIDDECNNLEGMIGDILDSSLIDVGQLEIERQPVRLSRLAAEAAREMQRASGIHHFVLDFPADFPLVDADPRRIRQVLRNILDNAIKYSPDGGMIVIRGEVRPADVVVSVADQGVGISPEDLIPLFDKYFRVKAPTGYYVPGTGLGLPVSRAIIEAHGGRIWAESKIAEGTTLFFSLLRQDSA